MESFESLMLSIDRAYDAPRCTTKNECKHQYWVFNAFRGMGRYLCSKSHKNCVKMNGDEECGLYEGKSCNRHIVK